ncbi:MAG: UDP-N-acetylmuramate dehydrogenase [Alphaproteobacteria bacterium]|nr:UDP-N-acetylmuramate dehydrogenase [Alphaproteobacteria bacterium]
MEKIYNNLKSLVRGRLDLNASLAAYTTLGVGGNADILFIPKDADDLRDALRMVAVENIPITIIGGGSNLLIRDGGIRGLVILITQLGGEVKVEGDRIIAPASARSILISKIAADNGIGGFEFLCGIPGTIGGALKGSVAAYGGAMSDVVESAEIMDMSGNIAVVPLADMGLCYRASKIPDNQIIISITMRGCRADKSAIIEKIESNTQKRLASHPVGVRTCGSAFGNPDNLAHGGAAWKLIAETGWQGRSIGGAAMSEKHANFLTNIGGASAADLEELINKIRDDVRAKFDIDLKPEVKIIGEN